MNATTSTPESSGRHLKSFFVVLGCYMAILVVTRLAMDHLGGTWRLIAAALPILPSIAAFLVVIRLVQNVDEFKRRIALDSLAIAGGITLLVFACYAFLEGDYLPHPSAWTVLYVLLFSWVAAIWIQRWRYR